MNAQDIAEDRTATLAEGSGPRISRPPALPVSEDDRRVLRHRLFWLMGGRLFVASLLLGGTLGVAAPGGDFSRFTPRVLMILISASYAGSLAFAVWLPRTTRLRRLAAVQIGFDVAITTGLVYVSGAASSIFSFLYGVSVLMAALLVGPRASQTTAVSAVLTYITLGVAVASGWIPHPIDQPKARYLLGVSDIAFSLLSNVVGLALVAVLAGALAERLRRTGGALRQAAESARSLARLNDDIVRSISSGLLTTDLDGRILVANPAAATMFGVDPETLVGRTIETLLPVEVKDRSRGEGQATRPDGSRFPVGFTRASLVDERGRTMGTIFSFQDLTELTELRRAAERAERLATLGRLSAGLAHEIRNPLSSISGSVELVREGAELSPEDRGLLGVVISEVDRLNDLVTTMLEVGRPREPARAERDLGQIAGEVVSVAEKGLAAAHRVSIDWSPEAAPVRAFIDGDQARQVIWNLLKNAVQVSAPGERVRITVCEAPRGDGAQVVVEDHGPGIETEKLSRLFETFFSERKQGVGLGLALVKQIVDAHGGRIDVDTTVGKGATFTVTFPRSNTENGG